MKRALKLFGVAIIFALSAGFAIAEPKHAIAIIGEPALPAGFAHLPYVNPDAPQGGRINYGVVGTFDNVNPFILKSMRTTARGPIDTAFGNLVFESLMVRSADEPFTLYGLLAETIDTDLPSSNSFPPPNVRMATGSRRRMLFSPMKPSPKKVDRPFPAARTRLPKLKRPASAASASPSTKSPTANFR